MTTRFLTLYIDPVARCAEVRIQRLGQTRIYRIYDGEPSAVRLGRLLAGRKHVSYSAQGGWGVTSDNGRGHSVYTFGAP